MCIYRLAGCGVMPEQTSDLGLFSYVRVSFLTHGSLFLHMGFFSYAYVYILSGCGVTAEQTLDRGLFLFVQLYFLMYGSLFILIYTGWLGVA